MTTREKIIETATELLLQKGYSSVSLNDIAKKVGIAKPSLYHYFPGKEALFLEVIDLFFAEGKKWMAPFHDESKTFAEALKSILNSVEQTIKLINSLYIDKEKGRYGYYFLIFDALKMFDKVRKRYESDYAEDFETVKKSIIRAQKNNEIRKDADWSSIAVAISALIEGTFFLNTLYPSAELDGIADKYFDILYNGIKSV